MLSAAEDMIRGNHEHNYDPGSNITGSVCQVGTYIKNICLSFN